MTKSITQRVKSKISSLSDGVAFASNSFHHMAHHMVKIVQIVLMMQATMVSIILLTTGAGKLMLYLY